jgi:hypothetical protein
LNSLQDGIRGHPENHLATAKHVVGPGSQQNNWGKQSEYIIKGSTRHDGETDHQKKMPGQP